MSGAGVVSRTAQDDTGDDLVLAASCQHSNDLAQTCSPCSALNQLRSPLYRIQQLLAMAVIDTGFCKGTAD